MSKTYIPEFDDDDYNEEEDYWDTAMQECGEFSGSGCQLAGTEYCEFECPFRDMDFEEEDEDE